LVGKVVRAASDEGLELEALPIERYQAICAAFEADVYAALDPMKSVERRNVIGGTAPESVRIQIQNAKEIMKK
jgi:argininosuccinate lyase